MKEVIRILTFILHNPINQTLFVKPESILKNPTIEDIKEFKWEIDGMSDSTWANKTEEGHSIAGWIIRIMGALAGWGCRQIKHITLSTAESEYAAALEMVKELQFVKNVMEWMGLKVKLPMKIYLDNQAAIMMIRNNYTTVGNRHCSLRVWYLRDLYMKGIIDPIYVKSELGSGTNGCGNSFS